MSSDLSAPLALEKYSDAVGGPFIRTLTLNPLLQWSNNTLYQGTEIVPLDATHLNKVRDDLGDLRGLLDGASLKVRLSEASLHGLSSPEDEAARLVFDLLEQLRVESLAPPSLPGMHKNIQRRFLRWAEEFVESGLCETAIGILVLTIALISWSRLNRAPVPEDFGDLIEATRANIVGELGGHFFALPRLADSQEEFSIPALEISRWVARAISSAQGTSQELQRQTRSRNGFRLQLHFQSPTNNVAPVALSSASKVASAERVRYRVFTRAYDREVEAARVVRSAQLSELRAQMDAEIVASRINLARLTRYFRRQLSSPMREKWEFSLEQGYLDAARLTQLIADPRNHNVFKDEVDCLINRSAVVILIDCSGSMKTHASQVSLMVDFLARSLEQAGGSVEVLGFTTRAWSGGRALKDWQKADSPDDPGRLSEIEHLIFKSSSQGWPTARRSIAALRRLDLYREGVDGEAVEWACERLRSMTASRRILTVISDGCPMDSATHQANGAAYLDSHLQSVVSHYTRTSDVEISAIGVGLDLGCFYPKRIAVDLQSDFNETLLLDIARMMASQKLRGQSWKALTTRA
ncbi:MAG: cobalt chelatase [Betaproteobacteria bacterium]|nr:cobalt chelatase [Betaproteobacteria bacterium]NBT74875.1 cobalt chelatase [Betaproteobacteria bacterium]NCA15473.1 cobalt chelatase [Betaproteobacteria bacterium]